ncbi:cleavage stimulating factor 64-like isoform X2 [Juglans microcarpa x Juglans regia]|uniref:cleavage stimulating factor 64-like isoform X2 n=1 Tax=Juglans microcarpa x Juglans regia TaxID=2249226 RepID=UPI001B7E3DA5|nr:cleavage stimulating factor 64-like isoform X2 [Juglans microcarpa x Juglans regia]
MASSQHRCVFVGNIPYDATEEQLIEICQEVGPVVSFRLVIDRETGKPKGYGFCEYKDEETALSARRNLQGYEINGRQLRVDFAENDKGSDRNREQGRGGPGLAANVGALGGAQAGIQSALANDPLTLRLAKMSRSQLNGIISELKVMATQNKELARQLLIARPQLPKALFQAQIMLGMVTPQVLQMPNIRQTSGLATQPPLHDGQQGQPLAVQTLPRPPAPAQNKMQSGLMAKVQDNQVAALPQNPVVLHQFSALPQPQSQLPQHANNHGAQQATVPLQSAVSTLTAALPQSLGSLSSRSQVQAANSSSPNHQMQPSLLQHSGQVGAANAALFQMVNPNATIKPSLLPRPPLSDAGFQPGPSVSSVTSLAIKKDAEILAQVPDNGTQGLRSNAFSNAPSGSMFRDSLEPVNRPQKLMKMDDGRRTSFSAGSLNVTNTNAPRPSQVSGAGSLPVNPVPKTEGQISQSQLPPDVESVLLQQVLNLTPEQLSLLPPEQQQQVLQLQQVLRRDQIQLS